MRISGYIWREDVIDKLAWKHQAMPEEVEEIFENRPRFERIARGHYAGEDVYLAAGQTLAGRYMLVFFIRKLDGRALINTARDMTAQERNRYVRDR
jgi:uncharacterized DUF497 family protein